MAGSPLPLRGCFELQVRACVRLGLGRAARGQGGDAGMRSNGCVSSLPRVSNRLFRESALVGTSARPLETPLGMFGSKRSDSPAAVGLRGIYGWKKAPPPRMQMNRPAPAQRKALEDNLRLQAPRWVSARSKRVAVPTTKFSLMCVCGRGSHLTSDFKIIPYLQKGENCI